MEMATPYLQAKEGAHHTGTAIKKEQKNNWKEKSPL